VSGLTRTDVAGLREAPLFHEPIAFRSLIAFPRLLALAVENRVVLYSALDILFKAGQYVFAIHSRPCNSELRDRISQVLYPSNLDGQQKVFDMTCIKQA